MSTPSSVGKSSSSESLPLRTRAYKNNHHYEHSLSRPSSSRSSSQDDIESPTSVAPFSPASSDRSRSSTEGPRSSRRDRHDSLARSVRDRSRSPPRHSHGSRRSRGRFDDRPRSPEQTRHDSFTYSYRNRSRSPSRHSDHSHSSRDGHDDHPRSPEHTHHDRSPRSSLEHTPNRSRSRSRTQSPTHIQNLTPEEAPTATFPHKLSDTCAYELQLRLQMEKEEEVYPRSLLHVAEDLKMELERELMEEIMFGDSMEGRPKEVGLLALLGKTLGVLGGF